MKKKTDYVLEDDKYMQASTYGLCNKSNVLFRYQIKIGLCETCGLVYVLSHSNKKYIK